MKMEPELRNRLRKNGTKTKVNDNYSKHRSKWCQLIWTIMILCEFLLFFSISDHQFSKRMSISSYASKSFKQNQGDSEHFTFLPVCRSLNLETVQSYERKEKGRESTTASREYFLRKITILRRSTGEAVSLARLHWWREESTSQRRMGFLERTTSSSAQNQ